MKNKLFVFMIDALCECDIPYMRTLPNFGSILERGALVEEMLPVYPSFTYPCHVSIMTGCYPRPPRHPPQRDGQGGRASRAVVHKARDGEKEVLRRVRQRGGLHHLPDQLAGERRRGRGPETFP